VMRERWTARVFQGRLGGVEGRRAHRRRRSDGRTGAARRDYAGEFSKWEFS
jgi:hypothetical protein